MAGYRSRVTLEDRTADVESLKRQRPDLVPVIVERDGSSVLPQLENPRFLVGKHCTIKDLASEVGARLSGGSGEGSNEYERPLYIIADFEEVPPDARMDTVVANNVSADGNCYLLYTEYSKKLTTLLAGEELMGKVKGIWERQLQEKRRTQEQKDLLADKKAGAMEAFARLKAIKEQIQGASDKAATMALALGDGGESVMAETNLMSDALVEAHQARDDAHASNAQLAASHIEQLNELRAQLAEQRVPLQSRVKVAEDERDDLAGQVGAARGDLARAIANVGEDEAIIAKLKREKKKLQSLLTKEKDTVATVKAKVKGMEADLLKHITSE